MQILKISVPCIYMYLVAIFPPQMYYASFTLISPRFWNNLKDSDQTVLLKAWLLCEWKKKKKKKKKKKDQNQQ